MKKLLLFISIISYFSCTQQGEEKSAPINLFAPISDNNKIYGAWTMCANTYGGMMIQRNVCQVITFFSSGYGQVKMNDFDQLPMENFQWTLDKYHLQIYYAKGITNKTFPDTNYYANIDTTYNTSIELTLSHHDAIYILLKEKLNRKEEK